MSQSKKLPGLKASIKALNDAQLSKLIAELISNTKLEQSALAAALAEKRRRTHSVKATIQS